MVTGQSTGIERQNLPNAVATVSASELTRAPTGTLESALQGKIPGALIQANSGAPGGGIQVNLRGVSTINAATSSRSTWSTGSWSATRRSPTGPNAVTLRPVRRQPAEPGQPGQPHRGPQPRGHRAHRGPEGRLRGGDLRLQGHQRRGHHHHQAGPGRASRSSTSPSGSARFSRANELGARTFATLDEALSRLLRHGHGHRALPAGPDVRHRGRALRPAALSPTRPSASVSGGTEQTKYYVSGLVKNDEGIAINTGYEKQSVRANLDQELARLDPALGQHQRDPQPLATAGSPTTTTPAPARTWCSPSPPTSSTSSAHRPLDHATSRSIPFERSNPLQTFSFLKNDEDVWRALGTLTAQDGAEDVAAAQHLPAHRHRRGGLLPAGERLRLAARAAVRAQRRAAGHRGAEQVVQPEPQPGRQRQLHLHARVGDVPVHHLGRRAVRGAAARRHPDPRPHAAWRRRRTPTRRPASSVLQDDRPVRDLGLYGQEELLLLDRRLLLTAGVRADRSSTNGDTGQVLPLSQGGGLVPVHPARSAAVDEFKLRGAYGQTGNQPLFGAKFSSDTTGTIGGHLRDVPRQPGGRPATSSRSGRRSSRAGSTRSFASGRAELNFTVYQRNISDLLLEQTLAPSQGQEIRIFSSDSKLRNRGVEAALTVSPVQSRDVNWLFRTTSSPTAARSRELSVPTFQTGGFGTVAGHLPDRGGQLGHPDLRAPKGNGAATPTPTSRCRSPATSTSKRFTPRLPVRLEAGRRHHQPDRVPLRRRPEHARLRRGRRGARRTAWTATGMTEVYVQDGSYLKLREVNLAYNLPDSITRSLFGAVGPLRPALASAAATCSGSPATAGWIPR